MLDANGYVAERLMDLRVHEEQRQAELRRLQRELQRAHQGQQFHQRCWLLCQLGRLSASLGVRFRHTGLPQPRPAGEQMLLE
jgi:hypothetical protein